MKRYKAYNEYCLFTGLFIVIATISFSQVLLERRSLIVPNDALNQYYCVFCYIGRWIREGIADGFSFKMYDSSIGFGESVFGVLNYYGLGDVLIMPFTLFPEKYLHYGYSLSIIVRMYLAGLSFVLFCRKRDFNGAGSIVGALMYSFSAYVFTYGLLFPTYTTVLVWLPLIAAGLEDILTGCDKVWKCQISLMLIVALFFLGLTGFYFLWMVLLYCLARIVVFVLFNRNIVCIKLLSNLAISFCLGIGGSSVMLLPVTVYFLNSARNTGEISIWRIFTELPDKESLLSQFRNLLVPPTHIYDGLSLSLPVLIVFCVVYLIRHKEVKRRNEWIVGCLICLYGCIMPAIGTIMNGGQRYYARWQFLVIFFFAVLVAKLSSDVMSSFERRDLVICIGLFAVWLVSYVLLSINQGLTIYRAIIFSVFWIVTIHTLAVGTKRKKLFFLISIVNICATAFLSSADRSFGGAEIKDALIKNVRDYFMETPLFNAAAKKTDDEWVRYDLINNQVIDSGLIFGVNTTANYYSIVNGDVTKFRDSLYIIGANGLDARQIPESLLSVRSYSADGYGGWDTADNDYFLPLGFIYRDSCTEADISKLSPLEKQSVMFDSVVLEGNDSSEDDSDKGNYYSELYAKDIEVMPLKIEYNGKFDKDGEWNRISAGAILSIMQDPEDEYNGEDIEIYLHLDNVRAEDNCSIVISGQKQGVYSSGQDLYLCLDRAISEGRIDIEFPQDMAISFDKMELIRYAPCGFNVSYNYHAEHRMNNLLWNNNGFTGNTSEETDGILFLSIPYAKGWECMVDGKPIDILRANYSFTAINIPAGEHNIQFTYRTPGLIVGLFISIICWCLIVVISIIGARGNIIHE